MRKLVVLGLAVAMLGLFAPAQSQEKKQNKLKQLMGEKLKFAQLMLEGLALADYPKISHSAEQLLRISNQAEWFVHKTPRYEVHSNEFRRASEAILQKAKEKNIDGAAFGYMELTISCVRCHQYVREIRDVRMLPGTVDLLAPTEH